MLANETPSKNGIAFDIHLNDASAKTPRRFLADDETPMTSEKRSLSMEDLAMKLDSAAERKKAMDESRAAKAKKNVQKAKEVASSIKDVEMQLRQEAAVKLTQRLEEAEKIKQETVTAKKQQASQHIDVVFARKEAANQECLSPGGKDIQEKLEKATSRRRSLVQTRLEKVVDHIRMVEMRRSQENLPSMNGPLSPSAQRLKEKLEKAEERRRTLDLQQQEKFQQQKVHAMEVRKRKVETAV